MAVPYSIYSTRSGTDANAPAIQGVTVSSTNTYYSDMWTGEDCDGFALSLFWTGTPTGVFTLWMTDKPNPDQTNDNDWVQDTTFAPTNPAGAAGKMRDDTGNAKAYRKRVKYVNASGSGVLTGFATVPRFK